LLGKPSIHVFASVEDAATDPRARWPDAAMSPLVKGLDRPSQVGS
jgi:hypothetical protein